MHHLLVKSLRHSGVQRGIAYKFVLCCILSFNAHSQSDTSVHSFHDTEQGP